MIQAQDNIDCDVKLCDNHRMKKLKKLIEEVGSIDGRPVQKYVNLLRAGIDDARQLGYSLARIYKTINDELISFVAFKRAVSRLGYSMLNSASGYVERFSNADNFNYSKAQNTQSSNNLFDDLLINIQRNSELQELI